jgi:hypothetical protein
MNRLHTCPECRNDRTIVRAVPRPWNPFAPDKSDQLVIDVCRRCAVVAEAEYQGKRNV